MQKIFLYIFLPVFILFNRSAAQSPVPAQLYTQITEENGLSDNNVTCVLKDKESIVWIGTADGLNKMDGSAIRIFRMDPKDNYSLPGNYVKSLAEDSNGNIWVGTGSGVCYYKKNTGLFYRIETPQSFYGYTGDIMSISIDSRQRVWCGTSGGLLKVDPQRKKTTLYYIKNDPDNANLQYCNSIRKILADSNENLWICTNSGFWQFDLSKEIFRKAISKKNDPQYHPLFFTTIEDSHKNLWVGTWEYGLKLFDRASGTVTNFAKLKNSVPNVEGIVEFNPGDAYPVLMLNGALRAFDTQKKEFLQFPKPIQFVSYPEFAPVYKSADNCLWFKSTSGLYIYDPRQQNFRHYIFQKNCTTQTVITKSFGKNLLIGCGEENFLKLYDSNFRLKKDFLYAAISKQTTTLSIAGDENNLWIGTTDGIGNINPVRNSIKWFTHKDHDSNSLPKNFITSVFIDSKEKFWVFPWRAGIWNMDRQTGNCIKLFDGFIKEAGLLKKLVIADAAEDSAGNIWMADLDEGIILYNRKNDAFLKPFIKQTGERNHTSKIYKYKGYLYSICNTTIIKWSTEKNFSLFYLPPEMDKLVYDFTFDEDDNCWIATKSGLICFNERNNSFKRFTCADGLLANDMNGSLQLIPGDKILFGTEKYFTSFDPRLLLSRSSVQHKILLTDIIVNSKRIFPDTTQTIRLAYTQNNIIFNWAIPSYNNPFHNKYYCLLNGIDSSWRYVGNKGEVQYANLSPGKYNLVLKAATDNGMPAGNEIRISFIINPPFWKTGWFICLMAMAAAGTFFSVGKYITGRNLKEKILTLEKEQAVEKERNRIAGDMHDDLGSGLTKIAILSEVAKTQLNQPEKAKTQLENIAQSSRELVDSLQDIIWLLNPKNDSLENLLAYAREYALKFFEPFETAVKFIYPEDIPVVKLTEEQRRNIFLVIKESFNNIAKHAWCNTVLIKVELTGSKIYFSVEDDGIGFDIATTRTFGNGLQNMKSRMEKINGNYSIVSSTGKGTITSFDLEI